MAEFFFACLQAVQKDLIALAIFAIGFGLTCVFQTFQEKAKAKAAANAKAATVGTPTSSASANAAGDKGWSASSSAIATDAAALIAACCASVSAASSSAVPSEDAAAAADLLKLGEQGGDEKDDEILACYEAKLLPSGCAGDLSFEPAAERLVVDAALRRERDDVLRRILTAPRDGGCQRQLVLLRAFCGERRLRSATKVFETCPVKTSYHYNTLLDAYIVAKDLESAEQLMLAATQARVADVVTYNTIIKAFVQNGNLSRARRAVDSMRAAGLTPNCVTFNELLEATIRSGGSIANTWNIVDEMEASGVKANHVTASIILKLMQTGMRPADVERAMAIVESISDEMDEVLLGSVIEACIRVNREDLLIRQLGRQRSERRVKIESSHTYGSMIRAFGYVRDVSGIWATWEEMQDRNIPWTSITLGNMVEALVQNGHTDSAYKMIQKALGDKQTKGLVNAVIYGSVLKGYSQQRLFDSVWRVYQEMLAIKDLKFSLVTYNTLVNACVRCREMGRISILLKEMAKQNVEPDTITYSAIIKGYCQEGQLDEAFELLDSMKQATKKYKPDEFTYNSLIDGCARQSLWDRGISLLQQMQDAGVPPSNFTLSVLVKLASRCKRLDAAFQLCEAITQKYSFKLNVHVYNNLVQACLFHASIQKSLEVFAKMVEEGVRPDVRTYRLLLNGGTRAGEPELVAALLRAAAGLPWRHPYLAQCRGSTLVLDGGLPSELVSETLESIAGKCRNEPLVVELLRELRRVPGLKLDSKMSWKLATRALNGS